MTHVANEISHPAKYQGFFRHELGNYAFSFFAFCILHFANQARVYFRILHPQSKIVNEFFFSVNKEIKTCNEEYLPLLLWG